MRFPLLIILALCNCTNGDLPEDGEFDSFIGGKDDAWGVESQSYLAEAIVNFTSSATRSQLEDAGVQARAVNAVLAANRPFTSLAQVDDVRFTGQAFFAKVSAAVINLGLVGSCGDGVVQAIAEELCDGSDGCEPDCRHLRVLAKFLPTEWGIVRITAGPGDIAVINTKKDNYNHKLIVMEQDVVVRLFGGESNQGVTFWGPNRFYAPSDWRPDGRVYNFLTGAIARVPLINPADQMLWLSDDVIVTGESFNKVVFRDRLTGEPIQTVDNVQYGGWYPVEIDGTILVTEIDTRQLLRLSLVDDEVQRQELGEDGSPWLNSRVQGNSLLLFNRVDNTEQVTLRKFTAGQPTAEVSEFTVPTSSEFVATNGMHIVHNDSTYTLTTADGETYSSFQCDSGIHPARVTETDSAFYIYVSDCRPEEGFWYVPKP